MSLEIMTRKKTTHNSVFIVFGLMTHLEFLTLFGSFTNGDKKTFQTLKHNKYAKRYVALHDNRQLCKLRTMRLTFILLCFLSTMTINVYGQLLYPSNSNTSSFNSGDDIGKYYTNLRNKMIGKELANITFRDSLGKTFDLRS